MKDRSYVRGMRVGVAAVVALAAALSATSVSAASERSVRLDVPSGRSDAPKPKSTFTSETEGSPQPTIVGSWGEGADTSNKATLTFDGGHVAGGYTRFAGTWISPPATASKVPEMDVDYDFAYSNALGEEVSIIQSARARYPGGKWGKWVKVPITLKAAESNVIQDANLSIVTPLSKPGRVEFQWKITGKFVGPATLHGEFSLSVS